MADLYLPQSIENLVNPNQHCSEVAEHFVFHKHYDLYLHVTAKIQTAEYGTEGKESIGWA